MNTLNEILWAFAQIGRLNWTEIIGAVGVVLAILGLWILS
jgi:hypothetical protein